MLIFVTGGARSGKSAFAEALASERGADVTYIATAVAFDSEMQARITRHRADRPPSWLTLEAPVHAAEAVANAQTSVILLDCLSVWVNNLMFEAHSDGQILDAADRLIAQARARGGTTILVTNEVGSGIVPDNALARRYRDVLGWVNQRVAQASDAAYLLASGLPLQLKGESGHP